MIFDLIIENVEIIDGFSSKRYSGEVALLGDTIEVVAKPKALKESTAEKRIDGEGCILAPGFIDIHSHDDLIFFHDPFDRPKLHQGVTTVVTGMCGSSPIPMPLPLSPLFEEIKMAKENYSLGYPWEARTFLEYTKALKESRPGINIIPAVGHGEIRLAAMGYERRPPKKEELDRMKELLKEALHGGAIGMSAGLVYPPGSFATTEEILELAKIMAPYEGIYFTHLRSEGAGMLEALKEAVHICREASAPLQIAHFKCLGRDSWGDSERRINYLEDAASQGLSIYWDQYPYIANSTGLLSLLPPWAQEKGITHLLKNLASPSFQREIEEAILDTHDHSWENFYYQAGGFDRIVISEAPGYEEVEGKTIAQLALAQNVSPFSILFQALLKTNASAAMVTFCMAHEDVEKIMAHPFTCIGSDGSPGQGKVHPRMFGTFAKVLGEYVREKKILSLEEAVAKMTSLPAQRLGLKDRGRIEKGYKGDLVLFDPARIKDRATYEEPRQYAEGIAHVLVNGELIIDDSALLEKRPGRVLLR